MENAPNKQKGGSEIYMPQNVYLYNPGVPVPKNVQHVEIPEGITLIPKKAFEGCKDLQSVVISDSVTKIEYEAFGNCTDLQSVTIPDSVTEIGNWAFHDCRALQSITIPDSVTEIGVGAFSGCSAIRSIAIPDGITEIRNNTFSKCPALQSVTLPESITEIDRNAFFDCFALQSIAIPNGVTKINDDAFAGCGNLQSVIIPDSVTEIGCRAFVYCRTLQSVTIPDSITEIGYGAFGCCDALQSVTIPDSVTEIGRCVFEYCASLQSVRIPDGVTIIGDNAFFGCSELQSIIIPDGVTEICDNAFHGCCALQSITIPDSVTKIGACAFEGCRGLQSVTIPDSITEIGKHAFERCSGLQSVTIPDGVTKIGERAFGGCKNLRSVMISDNVTEISKAVFSNCPALQLIVFKGINIAPFLKIDGYGVNSFDVIRALIEHQVPLNEKTVRRGIDAKHRGRLSEWAQNYPVFGEMRLSATARSADGETEERLRRCFATQKKTGYRIPKILSELAATACVCGIPPERLAATFDIKYTEALLRNGIPFGPAEACRCYYNRGICNTLVQKEKDAVMAEAISLYNKSGHRECYRHLMDFILSHSDTKIEDLQYAVDYAERIPMEADTTLAQVKRHRTYTENLGEVAKIEAKYGEMIPGFRLSDYPCNISPTGITYDGMTARVLDLSDRQDIALGTKLGELTNCCQRLGSAGETAMMHSFLNPDAGFWVVEDANGVVKAQAEIWKADGDTLVFDNIEFINTDNDGMAKRMEQLRGVIATWAMESGYRNIVMGCGYNEFNMEAMEQAPIPELSLTPEEVFALQKGNDAEVFFDNIDEARQYMQTNEYYPRDFVYTDADEQCVYIKKDGAVSDYLTQGYDRTLAEKHPVSGRKTEKEQNNDTACK